MHRNDNKIELILELLISIESATISELSQGSIQQTCAWNDGPFESAF